MPVLILIASFFLMSFWAFMSFWDEYNITLLGQFLMVAPLLISVGLFMLRAPINEWYYEHFPQRLDKTNKGILERFFKYYASLDEQEKIVFEQRLNIFKLQKEFLVKGAPSMPGDIQLLLCAQAARLTFGMQEYILPKLGTFVLYPKNFKTPSIRVSHAAEFNKDDYNCIVLSIEAFVDGMMDITRYYDISMHMLAKNLIEELGLNEDALPFNDREQFIDQLHEVRSFPKRYQERYTALKSIELFPTAIEHFFSKPSKMKELMPELYSYLSLLLNQDPLHSTSPVIGEWVESVD